MPNPFLRLSTLLFLPLLLTGCPKPPEDPEMQKLLAAMGVGLPTVDPVAACEIINRACELDPNVGLPYFKDCDAIRREVPKVAIPGTGNGVCRATGWVRFDASPTPTISDPPVGGNVIGNTSR